MNSTFLQRHSGKAQKRNGFTLVELLVVIAIIALLTGFIVVSLPALQGAAQINKAASDIAGILDQARSKAMADSTYTWVGFFEEDPTVTQASPAAAPDTGKGGLLAISLIESADGTDLSTTNTFTSSAVTPAGTTPNLIQVSSIVKIPNVHLFQPGTTDPDTTKVPRATMPDSPYQLGNFPNPVPNSSVSSQVSFTYPLNTANPQYKFTQIIQFSPRGDATRIFDTPTQLLEIALQPTHGNIPDTQTPNLDVVQVTGIGGIVTVYRP